MLRGFVVVVVVVVTITRIMKSVVIGQAPVTLEWRNTPGEKKHKQNQKWYTHTWCIIADAIHASARKHI